jgi:hypothetical protein
LLSQRRTVLAILAICAGAGYASAQCARGFGGLNDQLLEHLWARNISRGDIHSRHVGVSSPAERGRERSENR